MLQNRTPIQNTREVKIGDMGKSAIGEPHLPNAQRQSATGFARRIDSAL
jgi:hypothetical protein